MRNHRLLLLCLLFVLPMACAQEPQSATAEAPGTTAPYQLTLTLVVTDHGKKTIDQSYTLAAASRGKGSPFGNPSVRDTDHVPVPTAPGSSTYQYVDVGTNIDVDSLRQIDSMLGMQLRIENDAAIASDAQGQPVRRRLAYSLVPIVPLGKLTTIFSSGDGINAQKVEIQLLAQPLGAK
ncbi:hypothetical protein ACFPT7_10625 [Acidicapsa dinghuensis]|uniref:Type VI secretion system lipoprotein TssJ n=1 Tax=Acidicapsa dinghuensis TaxID=2218256 RepID=A0ABW1EF63_9BACT|nr:hypothetical protein [Acidicapsa dinghuensis]